MSQAAFKKSLPLLGFLVLSGITVGLWVGQQEDQKLAVLHHMENAAEQFRIRLVGLMNARLAALEIIRSRWVERQPPDFSRERFLGLAGATMHQFPGIAGIYWADREGIIQWVHPEEEHAQATGKQGLPVIAFSTPSGAGPTLEDRGLGLTPTDALPAGGLGFCAVLPLKVEGTLQGFLIGVFQAKQLIEMSVAAAMLEDYAVTLKEGDRGIYRSGAKEGTGETSTTLCVSREIAFPGKTWLLRLEPYNRYLRLRVPGHGAFLALGLALSALLALTLHLLLQRMDLYRASRDEALREIEERHRAEEHIRLLTRQLLRAQENERQRLSRDLHDTIGQDLSTLKIGIETLLDGQTAPDGSLREKVARLSDMLQKTIATVRDLAYDLRPATLDQLGLVQTIQQVVEEFSERTGIEVDFLSAGMNDLELGYEMRITLYRMIQEGLNNVRKHAEARRVSLRLVASFPKIIVQIEDDGKGFDVQERLASAVKDRSLGLRSMQERAALLGGTMRLDSRPSQGTRIRIEVPFREVRHGGQEDHPDR